MTMVESTTETGEITTREPILLLQVEARTMILVRNHRRIVAAGAQDPALGRTERVTTSTIGIEDTTAENTPMQMTTETPNPGADVMISHRHRQTVKSVRGQHRPQLMIADDQAIGAAERSGANATRISAGTEKRTTMTTKGTSPAAAHIATVTTSDQTGTAIEKRIAAPVIETAIGKRIRAARGMAIAITTGIAKIGPATGTVEIATETGIATAIRTGIATERGGIETTVTAAAKSRRPTTTHLPPRTPRE